MNLKLGPEHSDLHPPRPLHMFCVRFWCVCVCGSSVSFVCVARVRGWVSVCVVCVVCLCVVACVKFYKIPYYVHIDASFNIHFRKINLNSICFWEEKWAWARKLLFTC